MLQDRLGRTINNLRVSVTDRCNFRCTYCMPEEGLEWLPKSEILTFEEIGRLVEVAISLGITKVRLTGGEPLLRKNLDRLVRMLVAMPGLEDLSLTTNGLLLGEQAPALHAAGLRRVNVSLDSLEPATFQQIAKRGSLEKVLESLEVAGRFFEGPVKVNAVIMRGVNDHEIEAFAKLARRHAFEVRFIEFMPLDAQNEWSREQMITGEEILRRIDAVHPVMRDPQSPPTAPSCDYVFSDGAGGKIGFINSVTEPFCDSCCRIRVTADGKLRTCLFSTGELDLLQPLRSGASDEDIGGKIRAAVWEKEPGHKINSADFVRASRPMSQIGG